MIQPAEIARLAHRLGLGDKTIEKDYALTWTLLAIAHSPLRDRLAFKGGTALKKVYVPEYRFSEDLDFTLLGEVSNNELVSAVEALFPWLRREVAIHALGSPVGSSPDRKSSHLPELHRAFGRRPEQPVLQDGLHA